MRYRRVKKRNLVNTKMRKVVIVFNGPIKGSYTIHRPIKVQKAYKLIQKNNRKHKGA